MISAGHHTSTAKAFKLRSSKTGHHCAVQASRSLPRLGSPPLHLHHDADEIIYVLEGIVTLQVGAATTHVTRGNYAIIPRGISHTWWNGENGPASVMTIFAPGYEKSFNDVMTIISECGGAPDDNALRELAHRCGMEPITD